MSTHTAPITKEHPYSHLAQFSIFVALIVIWVLDSFVYRFSSFLANAVPLAIRLATAVPCLALGSLLLDRSHKIVFQQAGGNVCEEGVYAVVRHPMYLGHMLVYLSAILATLSLSSLLLWIVGFAVYDRLATYEEEDLIKAFGETYVAYRQRVPKWLPAVAGKGRGWM